MPEEKPGTTSQADALNKVGSAPDTDKADEAIFDNMTPEELKAAVLERDKQYNELRSMHSRQDSELGELRKLKEQVENDNKLATVLESVQALATKKEEKPQFDWEAYSATLAEKMAENPSEGTKDLLNTVNAWMAEDREKVKGEALQEIQSLKQQMAQMSELVETTTDDYKENKELIEKFREKGLSLKDAKAMAKEVRDMMPQERSATPPVGITPNRVIAPESKSETPWSNDDVARWKAEGHSERFIEMMKAKLERDAELTDEDKDNF